VIMPTYSLDVFEQGCWSAWKVKWSNGDVPMMPCYEKGAYHVQQNVYSIFALDVCLPMAT
jgi:hypothetical protein